MTRLRVSSLTPGLSLSARETDDGESLSISAISFAVTFICLAPFLNDLQRFGKARGAFVCFIIRKTEHNFKGCVKN